MKKSLHYFFTAVFILVALFSFNSKKAEALADVEFTGWGWSDALGWISLNCSNTGDCGTSNYKVGYNPTTGALTGYAWSENVGWIQFGSPSVGKLELNPASPNYGKLSGWARVISMVGSSDSESSEWADGWISLSGTAATGSTYGITFNMTTGVPPLNSYAWGNNAIGWINFSQARVTPVTVVPSTLTLTGTSPTATVTTATSITVPSGATVMLSSTGTNLVSTGGVASGTDSTNWTGTKTCPTTTAVNYANFVLTNTTASTITKTYTLTCTSASTGTVASTFTVNVLATSVAVPTVTTMSPVTNITLNTATGGGTLVSDGGSAIIDSGIVYGTMVNPTIATSMGLSNHGNIANGFSWTDPMSGFLAGTTYHVRAYAKNAVGISYGADVSFKTSSVSTLPVVITMDPVINITSNTATGGGTLVSDGGSAIIDSGTLWGAAANPSITNSMGGTNYYTIANGFSWTDPMSGFLQCTTYHVRAYAKNAVGISYGADVSFTTIPPGKTCAGPASVVILDGSANAGQEITPVHSHDANGIPATMTVKSGSTVTLFSKGQNVSTMNSSFNNAESDDGKDWNGHKLCPTSMTTPTTYTPSFVLDNPTNQIIAYYYRISCLNSVGGVINSNDFIINILPDICSVKPNDPACTNSRALLRVNSYDATSGTVGTLLETAEGNTSPGPLEQTKTITINQGDGIMFGWSKHNVATNVSKSGAVTYVCSLGKDNGTFGFDSASFNAEYPIWGFDSTTSDYPMYDTVYTLSCYAPAPGAQNMKAKIQVKVIPAPAKALLRIKDENGNVLATAIADTNNTSVTQVVTQSSSLSGHSFPIGWNQQNVAVGAKGLLKCSLSNNVNGNWGFSNPSFTPSLPFNWGEPIDNNPTQDTISTLICIDSATGKELNARIDFRFSATPPPGGDVMTLTSNNNLSCSGGNGFLSYYVDTSVSDKELDGCKIDIIDSNGKPVTPPSPLPISKRSSTLSFSLPSNNSSSPEKYQATLKCDATKNIAKAEVVVDNCQPQINVFEGGPTCTVDRSVFLDWDTEKMTSCKILSYDQNKNLVTEDKVDLSVPKNKPYEAMLVDTITYFTLNCDDGSGNWAYFGGRIDDKPIKITNVKDLAECKDIKSSVKAPIYKEI